MNCTHCGIKLERSNRFCPTCGTEIVSTHPTSSKKIWWLPISATVLIGVLLGAYSFYEHHVNGTVEAMRINGENLALQGQFDQAATSLENALKQRPNHQTIISDLAWVKQGQDVQHQLEAAQEQAKQGQFDQSLSIVNTVDEQTKEGAGSFHDLLKKQISDQKTNITIAQIKYQMKDKKTIEDLAPLLTKLGSFDAPDAKQAASDIRNQIADLAYEKANDQLKNRQFSGAVASIDQALSYDANNSKLLSFKETISQQQKDFEQTEQKRIVDAMVTAAKSDEKNRTQAVEIVNVESGPTADGNFSVKGKVKNVGTRPITMIQIYYTLLDANDAMVGQNSTYVFPNYLAPGETGEFTNTHYFYFNAVKAAVTRQTWYLN